MQRSRNKITTIRKAGFRRAAFLLLPSFLLLSGLLLASCETVPAEKTRTVFALNTVISVTYYDGKDREAVDRALASLAEYERIFSRTDPESELSALNASTNIAVPVSEDLFTVMKTAWQISEWTDGAFDCTLGGISDLYDFTGTHRVPSDEELEELLAHTGYEKVVLDEENRTVTKLDAGLKIDLGAIAKGYVADRMKEELMNAGVKRAILNLGGNVLLIGDKYGASGQQFSSSPQKGLFAIGIRDPESETPLATLYLADYSLVTSGTYERCFYAENVLYHHILDARTGRPVRNGLLSVSVVSSDSMTADALSTACFVLGEEKSKELLLRFSEVRVIFVNEEKQIRKIE